MAAFGQERGFLRRVGAMIAKELKQMRRDRVTFAILIGVPLMQMLLFGYAIDLNPRQLPTSVVLLDDGAMGRAVVAAMQTSDLFRMNGLQASGEDMIFQLEEGKAQFGVEIPSDFSRRIAAGEAAQFLLVADDTDPSATAGAAAAIEQISRQAVQRELRGPLAAYRAPEPLVRAVVQARYNPANETSKVIVPGLLGVILLLSLVINTGLAVTRERERGTMEQLLSMPLSPLEIMVGKIVPYISIGIIQAILVMAAAFLLFDVPMLGSWTLLSLCIALFIVAVLAVGYLISTVAQTQLQAMQMTMFFFLPNLLLSGFAFPFRGMPYWAQLVGEILPLTHFIRIVRGVMLKDAGAVALGYDIAVLGAFTVGIALLSLLRFRRTLD